MLTYASTIKSSSISPNHPWPALTLGLHPCTCSSPAHVSALLRALERRARGLLALGPHTSRAALACFEQGLMLDHSHAGLRAGQQQALMVLQQQLREGEV